MKVSLSYSGGTPTGLQLASQLEKRGYFDTLFQPYYSQKYPYLKRIMGRFEEKQTVNVKKVRTNLKVVIYKKILVKTIGFRNTPITWDRFRTGEIFDRWVANNIASLNSDIVLAESHIALHTIRKAKELGLITFLYRTNSHILIQKKIDSEETNALGIRPWHDKRDVEKGLREYDETDYIIVLSNFVKQGFIKEGIDPNKLLSVSLGIDVRRFKRIAKKDKIFRIIYCGGLSHRKGIVYLLEAIASLKIRDIELWLIGNVDIGMKRILNKYDGFYRHIGFVPNSELYKYYSQGSIFVLPSLEESFGRVIIEAMACGLPAIVTTNTAAGDVVRENVDGFVIPIRDVNALKEKILYLYENPAICSQMGENAMRRVRDEFTLDAFADRMIDAFKSGLRDRI